MKNGHSGRHVLKTARRAGTSTAEVLEAVPTRENSKAPTVSQRALSARAGYKIFKHTMTEEAMVTLILTPNLANIITGSTLSLITDSIGLIEDMVSIFYNKLIHP